MSCLRILLYCIFSRAREVNLDGGNDTVLYSQVVVEKKKVKVKKTKERSINLQVEHSTYALPREQLHLLIESEVSYNYFKLIFVLVIWESVLTLFFLQYATLIRVKHPVFPYYHF